MGLDEGFDTQKIKSMETNNNINTLSNEPSILAERALHLPIYAKLEGKRLVLASSSPRRLKILRDLGINPEQIPSNFLEDLDHSLFEEEDEQDRNSPTCSKALRYAAATASEKAIEVYTRLVKESPDRGPDLVIGADTVIQKCTADETGRKTAIIIEKPKDKQDQLSILEELMNSGTNDTDSRIEAITSVALVFPSLCSPGYSVKTFGQSTRLFFLNQDRLTLIAYVEQGEGIDRAGGFSIEGVGSQLIEKIHGDWNNVLGFPASGFVQFIKKLLEEDEDFLAD